MMCIKDIFRGIWSLFICGAIACSSQNITFADDYDSDDGDSDSGNYRDDNYDDDRSRNSDDDQDRDDDRDRDDDQERYNDESRIDKRRQKVEQTVDRLLNLGQHSSKSSLNLEPRNITGDIKRLQTGMKSLEKRISDYTNKINPPWLRKNNDDSNDDDESEDFSAESDDETNDDSSANEQENRNSATELKKKGKKSKKRRYSRRKYANSLLYTVKNINEIGMPKLWRVPTFGKKFDNFAPFTNRYKNYGNYKIRDSSGAHQKSSTATTYRVKTYSGSTANEITSKYAGTNDAYDHNQKHTIKNDYFKNPDKCLDKSRC
ncbi:MAG: hypothetical protein LBD81_02745 [Holosporaceae bacterium]|jgi:hypothetical protein|nr:hypothetical protein [Holosporaceae bacterium]